MINTQRKRTVKKLEVALIAFFVIAALSIIVVYFADPTIYTKTLLLQPTATDRYPLPSTLFLIGILVFISVLMYGVLHHWRWLFWLIFIANAFSILEVPATILQLNGVLPDPYPVWYSLYRMGIALIQVGLAIWMIRVYFHDGVWGMGKKKQQKSHSFP